MERLHFILLPMVHERPVQDWFLKIAFVSDVSVCVCVCVPAPEAINN